MRDKRQFPHGNWLGDDHVYRNAEGDTSWIGDDKVYYGSDGRPAWVGENKVYPGSGSGKDPIERAATAAGAGIGWALGGIIGAVFNAATAKKLRQAPIDEDEPVF